jgi:hypothetical protein
VSTAEILSELRTHGVHVEAAGEHLRYFGPVGSLPAELRARVSAQSLALVQALQREEVGHPVTEAPRVVREHRAVPSPHHRGRGDAAEVQSGDVCCAAVDRGSAP